MRTWPIGAIDRVAVARLERAVEDGQVLLAEGRGSFDRLALVDVGDDLLDLGRRVAELPQGGGHGVVDDLEVALADELLVLDERDVRLDAGRVAVHHEGDRAGRREERRLRVAVAVPLAELVGSRPTAPARWRGAARGPPSAGIFRGRVAMLADHAHERLAVLLELDERAAVVAGDDGALAVRLRGHDRGDSGGVGLALGRVVGEAPAHEQGAEVRVAEPERAEAVAVLLDLRRRVARVVDEDLLGRDRHPAGVAGRRRRRSRRPRRRTS